MHGLPPPSLDTAPVWACAPLYESTTTASYDPGATNANAPTAAIQSVITVNLTSNATLDLLLGGLLDNSTNGVNGTFQSITSQVPFMGFDAPVVSAMANAIVPSDGLGVSPVSQYPPPPPPPNSNPLAGFVNAVSSVATTVTGAVVSFANLVWTTAVAAAVFVDHLAREAAELGGQLLARVAATLASIGEIILSALEKLLDWLIALATAALAVVVTPFVHAAQGIDSSLGAAANASLEDINTLGYVTAAHRMAWAHSLDPLAEVGLALAVVIVVVLTILTPIDFEEGLVIGLVISLIPALAESTMAGLPALSALTSSAILSLESDFSNPFSKADWEAVAGGVAIGASSSDFFYVVVGTALKAGSLSNAAFNDIAATIIMDLVVFTVGLVAWASHLAVVAIIAFAFALLGTYLAVQLVKGPAAKAFGNFIYVSLGLAGVGVASALAEVILAES
jgi:hypothetical protein